MFSMLRRRTPPVIETLRIEHAPGCAGLHMNFFAHPWSVSEFESMIASSAVYGAAAIEPEKQGLAGFILTRRAADEAEILTLAVEKNSQKQGIGKALLDHQYEDLRRIGVHRLFLEVSEANLAARRLYEKSGFAQVGARPGYYSGVDARQANALILACDL